jgi:hypothetical protein
MVNEPWREGMTRKTPSWLRASAYGLSMAAAALSGSAVVILGMRGGASGLSAILLAAAVPLAGFTWVLTLSMLDRNKRYRHRSVPHYPQHLNHRPGNDDNNPHHLARSADDDVTLLG